MKRELLVATFVLLVLGLSLSGCVGNDDKGNTVNVVKDISKATSNDIAIVKTASGFEFLGHRELPVNDINSHLVEVSDIAGATEAFYQTKEGVDLNIQVIDMKDSSKAVDFVQRYRATFSPLSSGERFVEENINGHAATRILTSVTSSGSQVERYKYVWTNDRFVILVSGNSADPAKVRSLAEATGY